MVAVAKINKVQNHDSVGRIKGSTMRSSGLGLIFGGMTLISTIGAPVTVTVGVTFFLGANVIGSSGMDIYYNLTGQDQKIGTMNFLRDQVIGRVFEIGGNILGYDQEEVKRMSDMSYYAIEIGIGIGVIGLRASKFGLKYALDSKRIGRFRTNPISKNGFEGVRRMSKGKAGLYISEGAYGINGLNENRKGLMDN